MCEEVSYRREGKRPRPCSFHLHNLYKMISGQFLSIGKKFYLGHSFFYEGRTLPKKRNVTT